MASCLHRPVSALAVHHGDARPTDSQCKSTLETLPVEIVNQILSHLTHPRSRLLGLTEAQSAHDFPRQQKLEIKSKEDLTKPPDGDRWAADLFSWHLLRHPFNTLSLTSRRCRELVESYCSHLVRSCNSALFNLPFAALDKFGPSCVYPDLSGIVYRRLWLQYAPRHCIYCYVLLDCYPFARLKRVIAGCADCFYRQTLTLDEVERQYHISPTTILVSPQVRGTSPWVLRIDVEALAWRLYGTRAFHSAHPEQMGMPCAICAITMFPPTVSRATKQPRLIPKSLRSRATLGRKSTKQFVRC